MSPAMPCSLPYRLCCVSSLPKPALSQMLQLGSRRGRGGGGSRVRQGSGGEGVGETEKYLVEGRGKGGEGEEG